MEITLQRFEYTPQQTLGMLQVGSNRFYTLELGWHNNEKQRSCIPPGRYAVVKRSSSKYAEHFHVLNVPNRDYILIHHGNYYTDILGCILVGTSLQDINSDGLRDVTASRTAMKSLYKLLPQNFTLNILNKAGQLD